MTHAQAIRAIRDSGIQHVEELIGLLRPAARITRTTADHISPSGSYFGGMPGLPAGHPWPRWKQQQAWFEAKIKQSAGIPGKLGRQMTDEAKKALRNGPRALAFLAQINLAEMAAVDLALPKTGILLFFYEVAEQPWGFDPNAAGSSTVIYLAEPSETFLPPPEDLPPEHRYPTCRMAFEPITMLPEDLRERSGLELSIWTDERYEALFRSIQGEINGPNHQLGGYPACVQGNEMEYTCQYASNGIRVGSPEDMKNPRIEKLTPGAKDWRLLLQIDSDYEEDGIGWMWGDAGAVYFWMRQQDIAARAFERTWLDLQCG